MKNNSQGVLFTFANNELLHMHILRIFLRISGPHGNFRVYKINFFMRDFLQIKFHPFK